MPKNRVRYQRLPAELDAVTNHLYFRVGWTEKPITHEAMVNHQLNNAIAELERLQAARKQAKVPI
jgi:hypothetical protein